MSEIFFLPLKQKYNDMALFHIPQIKSHLQILKDCFGFNIFEIANELLEIISPHINERKFDKNAWEQCINRKGRFSHLEYALYVDENVEIRTTDNFEEQAKSIKNLCDQYIKDENKREEAKFILVFMSSIFNRNLNNLCLDETINRYIAIKNEIHPDLLKLFIALNKPQYEHDTPIKIHYKTDSPHTIRNHDGWLSDMLNEFVKSILGDITVEKAEKRLLKKYSDDRGRKSSDPYLNYIINGTYNYITHFLESDNNKVTVEQCKFLQDYLIIIERVKNGDVLSNLNTLQSTVKSFVSSELTPVAKHIKETDIT